jgi:hypothetical protein
MPRGFAPVVLGLFLGLSTDAAAGVVVSAAGLSDIPSEQSLFGVQAHVVCDRTVGFCWTGRFGVGYDLVNATGLSGVTELGGMAVIPSREVATIRFGVALRAFHIRRDLPIAIEWEANGDGVQRFGMAPQAVLQGELAWNEEAPVVTTAQLGGGAWSGFDPICTLEEVDASPARCITWSPSFVAVFSVRKTFRNGLTLYGSGGTLFEGGVGYRF